MPDPRVVYSPRARSDLEAIEDYIAVHSGDLRAALVIERVTRVCEAIASMPGIGRERPDLDGRPRVLPTRPWLIFYEPLPDGTGVLIQRIVDGRRDLQRALHK